jgi:CheY-like chemotaxis protein
MTKKLPERAYNISTTASGSAWIKRVANLKSTVILCNLNLPDLSGIRVLNHLKKSKPDVPVILLTAHGSREFKKYLIIS